MDESMLSGESHLLTKSSFGADLVNPSSSFMISGSKVMDGEGFMLVCTVGMLTHIGILNLFIIKMRVYKGIMKLALQDDEEPTPLQVKLEGLAEDIGTIGLMAAILTIAVLLIHLLVYITEEEVF